MAAHMRLSTVVVFGFLGLLGTGCSDTAFSLNGEQNVFQQSVTRSQVKVDILWVIDNSGSMETSQDNVAAHAQAFIEKFQSTNFDYQMAVTATDAYRDAFANDPTHALSRFRDGTAETSHTGIRVIKPDTPNLEQTFITNMKQGILGSGDERGWQSMRAALENADNLAEPFPRADALLAVIFLTDEDDFSHDGSNNISTQPNALDNPALHNPMDYYDFLFDLTNSSVGKLNFLVNTIGIFDQECLDDLNTTFTGRRIATRYVEVTELTGGKKGSLCDDFSDVLDGISDSILEKSTAFKLNREPSIETIVVKVDGVLIPMDSVNGWSYNPNGWLIQFHGDSIPAGDAMVSITFDPAGLK